MKAILEFTLPEEAEEHKMALEGSQWRAAMYDLDEFLKTWLKHRDAQLLPPAKAALQEVRDELNKIVNDYHGLKLFS